MAIRGNSWEPYEGMIADVKRDLDVSEVMPLVAVRILCYMTPEGRQGYVVNHLGDVPLSTTLGMLELAKIDLYEWHRAPEDDDA